MAAPEFVMHLIIPDIDGPIVSGAGPELPPTAAAILGRSTVGDGGRFATACGLTRQQFDGVIHRGTGNHTPSVNCKKCKATDHYKKLHEIVMQPPHQSIINEFVDDCC